MFAKQVLNVGTGKLYVKNRLVKSLAKFLKIFFWFLFFVFFCVRFEFHFFGVFIEIAVEKYSRKKVFLNIFKISSKQFGLWAKFLRNTCLRFIFGKVETFQSAILRYSELPRSWISGIISRF